MHQERFNPKDIWLAFVMAAADMARLDQDSIVLHETFFTRANPVLIEFHTPLPPPIPVHPRHIIWMLQILARLVRREDKYPMVYVAVTLDDQKIGDASIYRGGPWRSNASPPAPPISPAKRRSIPDSSSAMNSTEPQGSVAPTNSSSSSSAPLLTLPATDNSLYSCQVDFIENRHPVSPAEIFMAILNAIACLAPFPFDSTLSEKWYFRDSVTHMTVTIQPGTHPPSSHGAAIAALDCVARYLYHFNQYDAVRFTFREKVGDLQVPSLMGEVKGERGPGGGK